jgi:hypothetical protein
MDAATLRRLACCLALLVALPAMAVQQIEGLGNIDLGLWTPATGNVSAFDDFCVAARLGNSQNPARFAARVSPLNGTVYALRGVTNPANQIAFTFTFQDLTDNVQTPLVPSTYTTREQQAVRTCTGTNNGRIIASVLATTIQAAPPGEYLGQFRFTGQGVPSKTELSRDFTVRLRFGELIRISGLNAIDLGVFDGVLDRAGSDDFCVYSNGLTGRYTVTGTGQGTGGAFQVSAGVSRLPVSITYDDGAGAVAMTPGVAAQKLNAVSTSIDCIGGTNAQIRASVRASDMRTAASGTYAGVLTLVVAPI